MTRPWYLVMKAVSWDALSVSVGGTWILGQMRPPTDPNEPFKFAPIFKTKRAALKYAHGAPIRAIKPLEPSA